MQVLQQSRQMKHFLVAASASARHARARRAPCAGMAALSICAGWGGAGARRRPRGVPRAAALQPAGAVAAAAARGDLEAEAAARPKLPRHVALIMDGNARWASARGLAVPAGHEAGVSALRTTVRAVHVASCVLWGLGGHSRVRACVCRAPSRRRAHRQGGGVPRPAPRPLLPAHGSARVSGAGRSRQHAGQKAVQEQPRWRSLWPLLE